MTWHQGRRLSGVMMVAAWIATGCGSSSDNASIVLSAPEKGAELTLTDDLDKDEQGLQFDVKGTTSGIATGTAILLTIEGVSEAAITMVMKDGSLLFDNVTLPPGHHTIEAATAAGRPSVRTTSVLMSVRTSENWLTGR